MKIIAIANSKKGIGKSRTAWDLLVALDDAGIKAAAIDFRADGLMAALNAVRAANTFPTMPVFLAAKAGEIGALLKERKREATEIVLINTLAGCPVEDICAMASPAQMVLIPTLPTSADIASTTALVRPLVKAGKAIRFLLVQTSAGGANYDKTFLEGLGMTAEQARQMLVPTSIGCRPDFMSNLNKLGLGVLEAYGNASVNQEMVGFASQEIRQLRQFLRDELDF
ncbi:MAG TPA: hypothetical protein HPQ04_05850 [Rhodospirillaceae bacterium]|nr:hypothetical protein [Rhodospirillaceae bacterium]